MSKKEIIETGLKLEIDYSQTHSCYDPIGKDGQIFSCGHCDSCLLRLDGFKAAGKVDSISYIS
jgi:7-cyano-7-deazaguanine synthase